MTNLSPQAQAVLKAAEDAYLSNDNEFYSVVNNVAAAALRALADQVVPGTPYQPIFVTHTARVRWEERELNRAEILAIAAELENHQ
ncbi:MAG: hypothetical protein EBS87_12330 [Sphingomonadaceae bacterium]|nr:hypothetical protein [Sphingomonadaceae bacterium]